MHTQQDIKTLRNMETHKTDIEQQSRTHANKRQNATRNKETDADRKEQW